MNELIQALGNYTEALEQKITVLEERISGYEEKVAALEERIEELSKDSRFYVRPNSSPSETDAPCVAPPTPTDPSAGTQLFLRDSISAPLASDDAGCPSEPEPENPEEPEEPETPEMPENPESEPAPEPEPTPEPEQPKKEPELALEIEPQPAKTAVKDIRQMISLGDRFLFQRELFGQNGEKMQRALDDLNHCATEQEALEYVEKHFDWDKKSPTYELFINAIHRSHSDR